jgi:hypothetical protein
VIFLTSQMQIAALCYDWELQQGVNLLFFFKVKS